MLNRFPDSGGSLKGALWIDLFNPTGEETKTVSSALSISVPDRAELEEIESSSRLQAEKGVIQLSLPVSAHGEEPGPTPVGFVLSEKFLVTVRYTEMQAF